MTQARMLTLGIKEAKEQLHGFIVGDDLQLVSIFEVHDLIADVVSGFYEIHQRVTGIPQRFTCFGEAGDA